GLEIWILASVVAVLLWTATSEQSRSIIDFQAFHIFGQAIIVASGAFAAGGGLRFLFGIPKTLQAPHAPRQKPADGHEIAVQATNTNLEQISDWLTKILVGVGLTQLYGLRGQLGALGAYFAIADSPAVTLAILLNFSIAGFLTVYLLTRLFLTGA